MLTADDRELIDALTTAVDDMRVELRKLRTGQLVATLTEAEREEIAYRVWELVDARLAPREHAEPEPSPVRRPPKKRSFIR